MIILESYNIVRHLRVANHEWNETYATRCFDVVPDTPGKFTHRRLLKSMTDSDVAIRAVGGVFLLSHSPTTCDREKIRIMWV